MKTYRKKELKVSHDRCPRATPTRGLRAHRRRILATAGNRHQEHLVFQSKQYNCRGVSRRAVQSILVLLCILVSFRSILLVTYLLDDLEPEQLRVVIKGGNKRMVNVQNDHERGGKVHRAQGVGSAAAFEDLKLRHLATASYQNTTDNGVRLYLTRSNRLRSLANATRAQRSIDTQNRHERIGSTKRRFIERNTKLGAGRYGLWPSTTRLHVRSKPLARGQDPDIEPDWMRPKGRPMSREASSINSTTLQPISLKENTVHTYVDSANARIENISTGRSRDMPSRGFIWPGRNLCYNSASSRFLASQYRRPQGYVPASFRHAFPDRLFLNLDVLDNEVTEWHEGTTIVAYNYPLNETRAHFLMRLGNIFHLFRYTKEELQVSASELKLMFDDVKIPRDPGHHVQRELLEASFAEIPPKNILNRAKLRGLTCFRNVILHDWKSTPKLRMTFWPADLSYFRERLGDWGSRQGIHFKIQHDCTDVSPDEQKIVWIVQRRTKHNSRFITNIDSLKEKVSQVFGKEWKVQEFDSANTPCRTLSGLECLGYPICPGSSVESDSGQCKTWPSLSRDLRLFNRITVIISVHGATLMNTVFMPAGSTVVEIFPAGLDEYVYADFARRAGLSYFGWREPDESELLKKFPSLGRRGCFQNSTCRHTIREMPVKISVDKIGAILNKARENHALRCLHESVKPEKGEGLRRGGPGEPEWMYTSPPA